MGLLDSIPIGAGDPLGLTGNQAAAGQIDTAQANADLLRSFSDKTQANLQPFLDVSNRQLPGLEAASSVGGFFDDANALRPFVSELTAPIVEDRTRDLSSQLGAKGLTRSGFAGRAAADIQEDADLSVLLQLQDMLKSRRSTVAGLGAGTGGNLARLGQSSAENLASVQSQGIMGAAQAQAQGNQNFVNLAALGSQFIPMDGPGVSINQDIANNPSTLGTITPAGSK
jgi:hypothetical protein